MFVSFEQWIVVKGVIHPIQGPRAVVLLADGK